jgi:hypothetical protein
MLLYFFKMYVLFAHFFVYHNGSDIYVLPEPYTAVLLEVWMKYSQIHVELRQETNFNVFSILLDELGRICAGEQVHAGFWWWSL